MSSLLAAVVMLGAVGISAGPVMLLPLTYVVSVSYGDVSAPAMSYSTACSNPSVELLM